MTSLFECRVGGSVFQTTTNLLLSVPDSFFQAALSDTWSASGATFIEINRDGTHFQHVLDFLRFGHLPRDPSGRCNLTKEVLEAVLIEADFYGLPSLVKEIEELLKFNMKGMAYLISRFYLNSSSGGAVKLQEYATYEEALAVYEKYKATWLEPRDYVNCVTLNGEILSENPDSFDNQNIVINEKTDPVTGLVRNEVFQDGTWKRPEGMELLCVPLSDKQKNGSLYEYYLRSWPDNREPYE